MRLIRIAAASAVAFVAAAALVACDAVSLDDEAKAFTEECDKMHKELKDAKDDKAAIKKTYEAHEKALTEKRKAVKGATKWIGMSGETQKAYNSCRSETKSILENADPALGQRYAHDVLD